MSSDQGNKTAISIIVGSVLIALALYFGLSQPESFFPQKNKASVSPYPSPKPTSPPPPATTGQPSPSLSPTPTPTPEITWTKSDLITALSQKTGIPENEIKFSVGKRVKREGKILLNGGVSREGEIGGAAFFAVVDQNGVKVTFTGQGVPQCSEVNPYGYPISWADYCVDEQGNTIPR
jgi:hypothetical protein